MGRVYGWEATTEEVDDWVFDDITKTFIVDENNRKFFEENNPWALEEMSRRLIEAYQRELWNPEEGLIDEIQDTYLELEGFLEESIDRTCKCSLNIQNFEYGKEFFPYLYCYCQVVIFHKIKSKLQICSLLFILWELPFICFN